MVVEVESDSQILVTEGSVVVLSCEVYGYPRDSSSPVWTSSQWTSDELQTGRFSTSLTNDDRLSDSSVSSTERVVAQLSIFCTSEADSGEYTCSVTGNFTSIQLTVSKGMYLSCRKVNQLINDLFLLEAQQEQSHGKFLHTRIITFRVHGI